MFNHETTANETDKTDSGVQLQGLPIDLTKFNELVNGSLSLSPILDRTMVRKLEKSVDVVNDAILNDQVVYGVTTGFGGMCNDRIDSESAAELQANLLTFLAAAAGPRIDDRHTRGAMLLRANVLLRGNSGIRPVIVQQLLKYFQSGAVPVVRELGSIGASGDLVPLSVIARAVTGQSDRVKVQISNGQVVDGQAALQQLGMQPIPLKAKEGLALVNGTSFSCAIAANAAIAARKNLALSFVIQSMLMTSLKVDPNPFQPFVHQQKPHPGQIFSARVINELLDSRTNREHHGGEMVQDRYSLRCFPQYMGAIVEAQARIENVVETEMNSVSDNPLVDADNRTFYQSGNFLGQYIGIAMDDLRRQTGLLAKHLDVQIATLVAPEFNGGLSPSLRGNDENKRNMGLKGLQICGNSIMPMLVHIGNPIVDHYPTHAEQFNQNINGLSWGAANLAWKSVRMFQQYLAIAALFAIQAVDLRSRKSLGHYDGRELLGETAREFYTAVCQSLAIKPNRDRPYLHDDADRWLEQDIDVLAENIQSEDSSLAKAAGPVVCTFMKFCKEAA